MSASESVNPEEEERWVKSFVAVTHPTNEFSKEIGETAVVSSFPRTQLSLDPWDIVDLRSTVDTMKDFTDPMELKQSSRVATECQTYLQGLPKVELSGVYREQATQTLYMGCDGSGKKNLRSFDDIITILNKKILPQMKKSRFVQTVLTFNARLSYPYELGYRLGVNITDEEHANSKDIVEKEQAFVEALDIFNFTIDRVMWISELESSPKKETKNVEAQTLIKYNYGTKILIFDDEIQTTISCKPEDLKMSSVADCTKSTVHNDRNEDCMQRGIYSKFAIDNSPSDRFEAFIKEANYSYEFQGNILSPEYNFSP